MRKHVIIGTAGHVDHGKTCLIKALTGIDTDRLKEEKKRGITIELGFAYLDLPDGRRAGIIDVPGHEKFVKNMLAGAGGIDLAMLIVAADEGVMPQTVEHLDILSILGVKQGIVVITKSDLADEDLLELVEEDIHELTQGTFLESAPVIPVSVFEKQGLDELLETIVQQCNICDEREMGTAFRLPIDRVFTLKGFGTVVTGTLTEGRMGLEDKACLYPEGEPVRIRGIQVHGSDVTEAAAGQRVAVNIPGRSKEEIRRGDVLALQGSMDATMMADVRLEILKHTEMTIKHGSRVHFYQGARESIAKVVLLDRQEIKAGEWCYGQIRLEEPVAIKKGDRFVIRFYSPVETVGGGTILDAYPVKLRKGQKNALVRFEIKDSGTLAQRQELAIQENWGRFMPLRKICTRASMDYGKVKGLCVKETERGNICRLTEDVFISRGELEFYRKNTERFLKIYHRENPLKEGMPLEEFRTRLGKHIPQECADGILQNLQQEKAVCKEQQCVRLPGFRVVIQESESKLMEDIGKYYLDAAFAPLTTELYAKENERIRNFRQVFTAMLKKGVLIRLDQQYCVHQEYYQQGLQVFTEMAAEKPVQLGEYRDRLGCSRKIAVALLEHYDKSGFSMKTEAGRILKGRKV